MKKAIVLALAVGTVAILATATVVTAWGGVRALTRPNAESVAAQDWRGRGTAEQDCDGTHEGTQGKGAGRRSQTGEMAQRSVGRQSSQAHNECDECWSGRTSEEMRGTGSAGENRRGGSSPSTDQGQRNADAAAESAHDLTQVMGTVVQAPDAGSELIIASASGEEVQVGTGPGWLAAQRFGIESGDSATIVGFWEDGEFKATEITIDGETIVLRDESGRPMWAGQGRNAGSGQARGPDGNEQPSGRGGAMRRGGAGRRSSQAAQGRGNGEGQGRDR